MEDIMIDTLILSGGGPSGIAYIGIFKSLFENKILTKDLSGIKEIITASAGIIFSILYLLNLSEAVCEKIILEMDLSSLLKMDDLHIDDILINFGLFDNQKIGDSVNSLIKHCLHCENITLRELYEKIPIRLTVKVYNVTNRIIEYISYETYPDLPLSLLSRMTTAIPFFFTPIEYNNCLYVDGGVRGGFPIEHGPPANYLGINISGACARMNNEINELFPVFEFIYSLMDHSIKRKEKRIINISVNQGLNFDLTYEEKKEIIELGYETTNNHIKEYFKTS